MKLVRPPTTSRPTTVHIERWISVDGSAHSSRPMMAPPTSAKPIAAPAWIAMARWRPTTRARKATSTASGASRAHGTHISIWSTNASLNVTRLPLIPADTHDCPATIIVSAAQHARSIAAHRATVVHHAGRPRSARPRAGTADVSAGCGTDVISGSRPLVSRRVNGLDHPLHLRQDPLDVGQRYGAGGQAEPAGVLVDPERLEGHRRERRLAEQVQADVLVGAQHLAGGSPHAGQGEPRAQVHRAGRRDRVDGKPARAHRDDPAIERVEPRLELLLHVAVILGDRLP